MNRGKAAGYRIESLCPTHDRRSFHSGVTELDIYLRTQAGQDLKRKVSAVHILTADGKSISGYYTLSAGSISRTHLPPEYAHKLPPFPLPVTLLGRLAVSESERGRGLGEYLLLDALMNALDTSRKVASWAVIVDAKDNARTFYLRHSFIPMAEPPVRLFL